jgi:thioredoxin 1
MQVLGYILLVVLGLFIAMQWWMKSKAEQVVGQPLPKIDGELAERLKERGKALLYFYSPHCGPCRAMTPVIDRLTQTHDNVFKIDVSQDLETARKFQVMATPTLMLLSGGAIASVQLGAASEAKIVALLAN